MRARARKRQREKKYEADFALFFGRLKRFGAAFAAPFVLMMLMAGLSAIVPYLFRLFVGELSDELGFFLLGVALFALYLFLQTLIKMLWNYLLDGFGGKYIKYLSRFAEFPAQDEFFRHR